MKVVVRCAHNRVTKADMEREIERLFQENKDLRLSESHWRDEVNILRQQSEVRRQIICERDQHIQELEESLEKNTRLRETSITKMAEIQTKLYEQMREAIDAGAEINIELMEAEATIDEQKKRIEWLEEEVARLTNERDTAVDENTQLTFELTELKDKYEAERALRWNAENQVQYWRNEAQQKESNLRAAIEEREHWSDKAAQLSDEVNFYKSGRDASKKELEELDKEVERLRGVEETVETYRMARDVERQRRIEAEENYQSIYEEYERVRDAADEYRKRCQELTKIKEDRFDSIAQLIMKAVAADDAASKVLRFSEEIK